jgi:ATP-dependent RNA helicase RhlE
MIYGGVNIQAQIERLDRGVDMVVATPGRLLDHAERETIDLSAIEFLVLDEADRMLDLGFIDAILKVAEYLPEDHQTLLFSATYSTSIKELADELLDKPKRIEVARRQITADAVTQAIYPVERSRKREMLSHLIRKGEWNQVLVFVRTRYGADKLTEELLFDGIKTAAIHSNKSQSIRTRTLAEFKKGEFRVLVATDVAARGLDIEHLPHVVNYDLPQVPEDYVHRIGRTGRAGENGVALSLVCREEQPLLTAIEKLLKYTIPRQTIAEFPVIAVRRSVKAKEVKTTTGPTKSKKRVAQAKANAPSATPPRKKKIVEEKPAIKVVRRVSRTK